MFALAVWTVATLVLAVPWILWDRHYKSSRSFSERFTQIRQEIVITIFAALAGVVVLAVAQSLGMAGF